MSKKESHYLNNNNSLSGGVNTREGSGAQSAMGVPTQPLLMTVNMTSPSGRKIKN